MAETRPLLEHLALIAGIDEAGRGPLAGPVVAAAVVLPERFDDPGLDDSKRLCPAERERLAPIVREAAVGWCVQFATVEQVDEMGILQATFWAMRRALAGLECRPSSAIVDGNLTPVGLPCQARCLIGGDGLVTCIAAASILAKTARDEHMRQMAEHYPGYGFDHNFGYATPEHFRAIDELGPCAIHRRSFDPVRTLTGWQRQMELEFAADGS